MRICIVILLCFCNLLGKTEKNFRLTEKHRMAYDLIISMRFEEGSRVINEIKEEYPDNVLVYHLENYIDFISLFISEDEEEFNRKKYLKDYRLDQIQQGNPNDPYFLFSQAEIHLQWAMTRVKFHEYLKAAREINRAIGMLEKNQELFPDFISNKKSLSVLHAVAGTIPDKYKGVVGMVSNFSGTIDQGYQEILEVLLHTDDNYLFRKEAIAIKAMIQLHLKNEKQEAWKFLSNSSIAGDDDPMAVFLMANTAMNCGKNEEAIRILSKRTRSPRFYPFYYLDLMLGSAKLFRLDEDADVYLKSYVQNFEGQDYFKDAYRKLSWHALAVKEDYSLFEEYRSMCLRVGDTRIDEDKSAYRDAEKAKIHQPQLLKARLLFDGGYFQKANELLSRIDRKLLSADDQVEYLYRKGRVFQELVNIEPAISNFKACLEKSEELTTYYPCASAMQLGVLYEQRKEFETAESFYRRCLSMNPPEYKNSLHQKAKTGLRRLRK